MDKVYVLVLGLSFLAITCQGQLSPNDPCRGRKAGFLSQAGNCQIFIECTETSSFRIKQCPSGTLFDDVSRRCVLPSEITRNDCNIGWNGPNQNRNRQNQNWNRPNRNQFQRFTNQNTNRPNRNQFQRSTNQNTNRRTQSWNRQTQNRNLPNRNQFQRFPTNRRPTYRQTGQTSNPTWQTAVPSWQQWTNQRQNGGRWTRPTRRPWTGQTTRRPWRRPIPNQGSQVFINVVSRGQNSISRINCQQLQRDVNFWMANQARTYCRNCQITIPTISVTCSQRQLRG